MKRTITVLIICLIILPSHVVISELTQEDYSNEPLRFLCTDGDDFNEVKYQQMVEMYEQQKREPQSFNEIEPTITQESIHAQQISSDDGIMDSPWLMKCHDNKHSGRSQYSTIDNNGAELWNFKTNNWIQGGPVIDQDGIIYFGDFSANLHALYPDGSLKWVFDGGGTIWGTPAIDNSGIIYFGSFDGHLYAIDSNGILKWRANTQGTISSSPAISEDGTIVIGNMIETDGGNIVAINPDGSIKWVYETAYFVTSDPAIADDGTILIGSSDNSLYAINPDGALKWRFETGHYIKGPPSIAEDGTIYVGSYDDYLYALYPNGELKWRFKLSYGTETNPSIGLDGTIYVGDDKLYAINPDGTLKWTYILEDEEHIFQSSPAISADGTIYVGTHFDEMDGGDIIAINSDGTLRWRHRIANDWVDSSPSIDENGIVYIGSSSLEEFEPGKWADVGYLYAFGYRENINNPPNLPEINGPNSGKTGETYSYKFSATDPDNDQVSYYVEWGDNTNSGWIGPYNSGTNKSLSHMWLSDDTYTIRIKARDDDGEESDWATLEVTMPKSRVSLWVRLVERWPFFGRLVDYFEV